MKLILDWKKKYSKIFKVNSHLSLMCQCHVSSVSVKSMTHQQCLCTHVCRVWSQWFSRWQSLQAWNWRWLPYFGWRGRREASGEKRQWVNEAWKRRESEGEFATLYKEIIDAVELKDFIPNSALQSSRFLVHWLDLIVMQGDWSRT